MPRALIDGDAAIQRSNANAQSVSATRGNSGSGAATVATKQAKIDASRGARHTRSIATGIPTRNDSGAPPGQAQARQHRDTDQHREDERPVGTLAAVLRRRIGRRRSGRLGCGPDLDLWLARAHRGGRYALLAPVVAH